MITILKYQFFSQPSSNDDEVTVGANILISNDSDFLCDNYTVRVWIEGENSKDEPVQIVLVEHLYIKPHSETTAHLSGVLFYPLFSKFNKTYRYQCRIELLNQHETPVSSFNTSLSI